MLHDLCKGLTFSPLKTTKLIRMGVRQGPRSARSSQEGGLAVAGAGPSTQSGDKAVQSGSRLGAVEVAPETNECDFYVNDRACDANACPSTSFRRLQLPKLCPFPADGRP